MTDNAPEVTDRPSPEEMFDSLNGFEEIAITTTYGHPVAWLAKNDETQFLRALIMIHHKRTARVGDGAARAYAQNLPLGEVRSYFPNSTEDVTPEAPETAEGKGA